MSKFFISFSYLKFGMFFRIGTIMIEFTNIEDINSVAAIDTTIKTIKNKGYKNPQIINFKKIEQ